MRDVLGVVLGFVVSANSYALDCAVLSERLVGVPLDEKIENLEGYVKTEYVIKKGFSILSFWKRRGDIQEDIKIYYSEGEADRMIATYRGFSKQGASARLDQLILAIGDSHVVRRDDGQRLAYHVRCDRGVSADLFINEWHIKSPPSFIVNLVIK